MMDAERARETGLVALHRCQRRSPHVCCRVSCQCDAAPLPSQALGQWYSVRSHELHGPAQASVPVRFLKPWLLQRPDVPLLQDLLALLCSFEKTRPYIPYS